MSDSGTASKSEKPVPAAVEVTVTVTVDEDWIEFLTKHPDIFGRDYCGYWLRGVEHDDERGWLVWEDDEEHRKGDEPGAAEAVAAWQAGEALPEGWYRLDRALAIKAWGEGVKRSGVDWYENGDGVAYDCAVQMALLGEVRYG